MDHVTVTALLAGLGAVIAAIVAAYLKGARAGRNAEHIKQVIERDNEFDRIDSQRPDLDASLGRLRDRTGKPGTDVGGSAGKRG